MPLNEYTIVSEDVASPAVPARRTPKKADDRRGVSESRADDQGEKGGPSDEERASARGIIDDIGREFAKLRENGRSQSWADLESRVATHGGYLISTGMISLKDWVGTMIDIEQFRKAEGGTLESPGDALAKWLSEGETPKKAKKVKTDA